MTWTPPYKPAEIETRCQRCGMLIATSSLVSACSCGELQQLPARVAEDFAAIRRYLDQILKEKEDERARKPAE